jgi:Cu2+-exporting ATPase
MSSVCYHCGEAIAPGVDATLSVHGATREFCCLGCMAIAEMLVSHRLDNFYRHRSALSRRPDTLTGARESEIRLYDEAELQAEFVELREDGAQTAALNIQGITCAACIWLLEREVSRLPGVLALVINHSSHKAHLVWRQAEQPLSEILLLLLKLGFRATPYREDQARKAMQQERRITVFRIAVAGIAMMQNMMFSVPLYLGVYSEIESGIDTGFQSLFRWVSLIVCLPVVLFSATPFFRAARRDVQTRHLSMDVPVSIAILLAFLSSAFITVFTQPSSETDVYFDSISMFVFFLLLGRFVEMQTRHRHLDSDAELQQLVPSTALIRDPLTAAEHSIPVHRIQAGTQVVVRQGQVAPVDGVVLEGRSRIDESALTGEYLPLDKAPGDTIHAGTANIENTLVIEASGSMAQSRVAAIVRLLDQAQAEKPRTVQLADQVASHFVAAVLMATVLTGIYWSQEAPTRALVIMLSVLIATCPCALALATPTALTAATTVLRRLGFIITRGHTLEALSNSTDLIFDKTGTLTEGSLQIEAVHDLAGMGEQRILQLCAALEAEAQHPIATAFRPWAGLPATAVESELGSGLRGVIEGKRLWLGTRAFVTAGGQTCARTIDEFPGLQVWLGDVTRVLAVVQLSDRLRDNARECVARFRQAGLRVHLLSGDHAASVAATARQLDIEHYRAGQSPEQKLDYLRQLERQGARVAMVGDGINDLPVLSGARLSIAMGNASDLAKLNSDAILLNSHLEVLNLAFQGAHRTRVIMKENIAWAIAYNASMLPLAAAGMVPPWAAAAGMSLSSLLVVFNSLRLRRLVRR